MLGQGEPDGLADWVADGVGEPSGGPVARGAAARAGGQPQGATARTTAAALLGRVRVRLKALAPRFGSTTVFFLSRSPATGAEGRVEGQRVVGPVPVR